MAYHNIKWYNMHNGKEIIYITGTLDIYDYV